MRSISLDAVGTDGMTELQNPIRSWRLWATVRFKTDQGVTRWVECLFDSGAPFGIVPHSIWSGRDIERNVLGSTAQFPTSLESFKWQGISCDLAVTRVDIKDDHGVDGPFTNVAFLPLAMLPPHLEQTPILGLNFLVDNNIKCIVTSHAGFLTAWFETP
jgi:hypothetical protein